MTDLESILKNPGLTHIVIKILSSLDSKSLAKCRLLGNAWKQEIDNNKKLLIIQWKQVRQTKLICKDLEESSFEAHLTIWKETFDLVEFMTVDNIKLFLKISRTFIREVLVRNEVDKTEAPLFPVAILEKVAYKFTKVLFKTPYDFNSRDRYGRTCFMYACKYGCLRVVKLLLANSIEKNIDVNARDHLGKTALSLASIHGYSSVVKYLLENSKEFGINPNRNEIGIDEIMDDGEVPEEQKNRLPLSEAIEMGHYQVVKVYLDQPNDIIDLYAIDDDGFTPLHYACQGNIKILDLFISYTKQKQINWNVLSSDQRTPLHYSVGNYCNKVVNRLLETLDETQIDVTTKDAMDMNLFCRACWCGNLELAQILLDFFQKNKDKHVIDVNEKDIFGKTAFYYASRENEELEKLLLDNAESFNIDTNIRKKKRKNENLNQNFLQLYYIQL